MKRRFIIQDTTGKIIALHAIETSQILGSGMEPEALFPLEIGQTCTEIMEWPVMPEGKKGGYLIRNYTFDSKKKEFKAK